MDVQRFFMLTGHRAIVFIVADAMPVPDKALPMISQGYRILMGVEFKLKNPPFFADRVVLDYWATG